MQLSIAAGFNRIVGKAEIMGVKYIVNFSNPIAAVKYIPLGMFLRIKVKADI